MPRGKFFMHDDRTAPPPKRRQHRQNRRHNNDNDNDASHRNDQNDTKSDQDNACVREDGDSRHVLAQDNPERLGSHSYSHITSFHPCVSALFYVHK